MTRTPAGEALPRLSLATLDSIPARLRPRHDPRRLGVGIVHLGIGAFHRAHQAIYTEDALAVDPGRWGICGVTQRSRAVVGQLAAQDGLYTVLERGAAGVVPRVVGSVREVISALDDWPTLSARLADPQVTVVTMTVTEKGYRHVPATRRLNMDDDNVRLDLQGHAPHTVVGQLVRGLQARRAAGAGPITLVSCDNLPSNGHTLHAVVADFVAALPAAEREPLADWIAANVGFPATMVDRIVPATTAQDRAEVSRALGVDDQGTVVAEPFTMWVIEDAFTAARPTWEAAGALVTDDVAAYELMKLRMLNGSHSALAYLGALADHETVADAVGDPLLRAAVDHLLRDEVAPTLRTPPGIDLDAYRNELLARYANPALRHRTLQIAMDGTQKLPQRLLGTIHDRLDTGASRPWLTLAVAAWMRLAWLRTSDAGTVLPLDDPLAARITDLLDGVRQPGTAVDRLFGLREVFDTRIADDTAFRSELIASLTALTERGIRPVVRDMLESHPGPD